MKILMLPVFFRSPTQNAHVNETWEMLHALMFNQLVIPGPWRGRQQQQQQQKDWIMRRHQKLDSIPCKQQNLGFNSDTLWKFNIAIENDHL